MSMVQGGDVDIRPEFYLSMVLKLDGNSGIGAHVMSNLCYLICSKHSIDFQIVFFFLRKDLFSLCVGNIF